MTATDQPLLVVRQHLSPNPLHWYQEVRKTAVWALLPALGAMVALFFGSESKADLVTALTVFAPYVTGVFVVAFAVILWRRVRLDRSSLRLYRDRITVDNHSRRASTFSIDIDYRSVHHLELSEAGEIRLIRGLEGEVEPHQVDVPVGKHRAPDTFDFLVDHMERSFPDQVQSIVEEGRLRYSRPWELQELFAWQESVRSASLDAQSARTEAHSYRAIYRNGYHLAREENTAETLFRASRSGVRHGNGMVLVPEVRDDPLSCALVFDQDDGDATITVQKASGVIQRAGRSIGRIEEGGLGFAAEVEPALPELYLLIVLAVFADSQRAERMRAALS